MIKQCFKEYYELLKNNSIGIQNRELKHAILKFSFDYIDHPKDLKRYNPNSSIIIINECNGSDPEEKYFLICYKKKLVMLNQSIDILQKYLSRRKNPHPIYFLTNNEHFIEWNLQNKGNIIFKDEIFEEEIRNFANVFTITRQILKEVQHPIDEQTQQIWKAIQYTIAGYLIKESYKNSKKRIKNTKKKFEKNEFIELRVIDHGSLSKVVLYYHISRKRLFAIKKPNGYDAEIYKLFKRELQNYLTIEHPLMAHFYGIIKNENWLVIEFINDNSLESFIKQNECNFDCLIIIIKYILLIIHHFHQNNFVYRDLKPNNVFISKFLGYNIVKKYVPLIVDFDRMVKISDNDENIMYTKDFDNVFVAPEVNEGKVSYANDIYSLGQIIFFIFNKVHPSPDRKKNIETFEASQVNEIIQNIYKACTNDDFEKRPSIDELIFVIYLEFDQYYELSQNPEIKYIIDIIKGELGTNNKKTFQYYEFALKQKSIKAQSKFGDYYYRGEYVNKDIDKAIYYYTLAADQNNLRAQTQLVYFYSVGFEVTRDIDKIIHYGTLAAAQNDTHSQILLGDIYLKGKFVPKGFPFIYAECNTLSEIEHCLQVQHVTKNVNKAIHYYTLAAKENDTLALIKLGNIYCKGKYVTRDIDKAIHYYKLAVKKNNTIANVKLGDIYLQGKYITRDIDKAIHYYTLAARNDPNVQTKLGDIYFEGQYVVRDIDKAIHYYTLASKYNQMKSLITLGVIYLESKYNVQDFEKAIYYFTCLAESCSVAPAMHLVTPVFYAIHKKEIDGQCNNYALAHILLGFVYSTTKYINYDINKAIHHFMIASSYKPELAAYYLGFIYYHDSTHLNINKAIYYTTLAANQKNHEAQFLLGKIYSSGKYIPKNMNKAIYYFTQSSQNKNKDAHFISGYFYHEGKYVKKDINKAISYYREGSTFGSCYAKNNLGNIYMNNLNGNNPKNIGMAISYLEEAARQLNDKISMYNLSHIFLYEDKNNERIDESIKLLISSIKQNFLPSKELLCIALIKKYGNNLDEIYKKFSKYIEENQENGNLMEIVEMIYSQQLYIENNYELKYKKYKNIDFIYDNYYLIKESNEIKEEEFNKPKYKNMKDISSMFYEGFGLDI